jgi:hypothetical protein
MDSTTPGGGSIPEQAQQVRAAVSALLDKVASATSVTDMATAVEKAAAALKVAAEMEDKTSESSRYRLLLILCGCGISILFLLGLGGLHLVRPEVLNLPVQWLWVSAVPLFVALIVSGVVSKLEAGPIKGEAAGLNFGSVSGAALEVSESGTLSHEENEEIKARVAKHAQPSASASVSPFPVLPSSVPVSPDRTALRAWFRDKYLAEYGRTNSLVLVHVIEPSKRPDMAFDVTIFLMRHVWGSAPNQITGFDDIEEVEFYLGPSWDHPGDDEQKQPFEVYPKKDEPIALRTSAWGRFLAMCRVTFKDKRKDSEILFRYIDFEMATAIPSLRGRGYKPKPPK